MYLKNNSSGCHNLLLDLLDPLPFTKNYVRGCYEERHMEQQNFRYTRDATHDCWYVNPSLILIYRLKSIILITRLEVSS